MAFLLNNGSGMPLAGAPRRRRDLNDPKITGDSARLWDAPGLANTGSDERDE
jgi:hypothetical protein